MRRLFLLAICICLGTASSLTAIALLALDSPLDLEARETEAIRVVRSFYAAANAMIVTGDPMLLREVASAELRNPAGDLFDPAARENLEYYLTLLHEQSPQSQILLVEIGSRMDRVVTRATIERVTFGQPFGLVPATTRAAWPAVESFVVAGGQIVERNADWSGLLWLHALQPQPFDPGVPTRRIVRIASSHFEPGARLEFPSSDSIAVLHVEHGSLEFTLAEDARMGAVIEEVPEKQSASVRSITLPGQREVLENNMLVLVPPGSSFVVQNQTGETASLTSIISLVPQADEPEALLEVIRDVPGVTLKRFLSVKTSGSSEPMIYRIGLATMMPGAVVSVDDFARFLVVCPVGESSDQILGAEAFGYKATGDLVRTRDSALEQNHLFNSFDRPVTFFTISMVPAST